MPFPLIALLAKKVAAKGAQKGAEKIAAKGAEKVAAKGAQKGASNLAKNGMKKFGSFEKENWKSNQKANQNKGSEEDSKYEYTQTSPFASPPKFHKGGIVRKGGLAELKKNEVVLTAKQARDLSKKKVGGKESTGTRKSPKGKKHHRKHVVAKRS
jgi:hypothetical protein